MIVGPVLISGGSLAMCKTEQRFGNRVFWGVLRRVLRGSRVPQGMLLKVPKRPTNFPARERNIFARFFKNKFPFFVGSDFASEGRETETARKKGHGCFCQVCSMLAIPGTSTIKENPLG